MFDLFFKYILLLFLMVLASNWSIFVLFVHLSENEEMGHGNETLKSYAVYFYFIHFLFFVLFGLSFAPTYGAICNESQAYRKQYSNLCLILVTNLSYSISFLLCCRAQPGQCYRHDPLLQKGVRDISVLTINRSYIREDFQPAEGSVSEARLQCFR